MKILMVNKFFYIKGGSETYYFALKKLLERHGHAVVDFSMQDEKNFLSPYADYFVENVEYNGKTGIADKLKMSSRILYSLEAKKKLEALILKTKPDLAHLHIFQHQMSPSILSVFKKYKIPVVYTAHDLKMLCPNYKMLNSTGICEKCNGHKYYNCVKYQCIKESAAKSLICMLEGYLHQMLHSYEVIAAVITPSRFYYDKFLAFGISEERLHYLPNFLEEKEGGKPDLSQVGEYFLYVGRLSGEKGIFTLLEAAKRTGKSVWIAGTGPLEEEIKDYLQKNAMKQVKLLGFQKPSQLRETVLGAKALVIPSEWYENSPYSAIEALSLGRLIIGADIGGIPEMIREGENGLVFPSGNAEALADCMNQVAAMEDAEMERMQGCSRGLFEEKFMDERHYRDIMEIYHGSIGGNRGNERN